MPTIAKRTYDAIVRAFLYPPTARPRALSRISETIVIVIFLIAVIAAIPPAKTSCFAAGHQFRKFRKQAGEK
jgi:hypothetical protein